MRRADIPPGADAERVSRPVCAGSALVVVPTYQEAGAIEATLGALAAGAPGVDALVVDDASPDGTADIVEDLAATRPRLHLLRRPGKAGLGPAYLAGFAWGLEHGYAAVVEMDADGSHDPAAVPALLAALGDADLVIGSRYVPGGRIPGWSLRRRWLSAAGNRYASVTLGLPVADLTSGFRAFRSALLAEVTAGSVHSGGYGFQIEMAYRAACAGARIVEVPICFVDRTEGSSKMSASIAVEALVRVTGWALRRRMDQIGAAVTWQGSEELQQLRRPTPATRHRGVGAAAPDQRGERPVSAVATPPVRAAT